MKQIFADHHARKITRDGVEDFYWPITHKPMTEFGVRFFYECADLLREYPDQKAALPHKFSVKYLVAIAGGVFQSDLLKAGLDKDGKELVVPDSWFVWPYMLKNLVPPRTTFLETLRRKKSKASLLKKLLDFKRYKRLFAKTKFKVGAMEIDGLRIAPLSADVIKSNIITTQRTHLISRQARSLNEDVILGRSDGWFSSVSEEEIQAEIAKRDSLLEQKLLDIIIKLYAEKSLTPSATMVEYFKFLISESAALLGIHYNRLLSRSDIPKRLWTGTGGQVWDLMLRSAVIAKGGHVTAFDHGGGTAHVSIPLVGFIELWACHEFVTFNARQADDLRKAAPTWPRLDNMNPKISYVPPESAPLTIAAKKSTKTIKKIYVLSTLYDQDRGRSFAFYPDLAYVDWQARLMAKLQEWGYEVYFKPHPESRTPYPDAFEKSGVHIVNENFETILQDADLFLIDYTYTSIMIPAFLTETPIVLVDFDDLPWHEDAYMLIQQRAALVEGGFDAQNRIKIDWDELKQAITAATEKCSNHDYARTYYI